MTDDERITATMAIMREIGYERGQPASVDQIEKAKKLAKEKGLDPDLIAARLATPGGKKGGGGRDGGPGGGGPGGSSGRRPEAGGDRGFNTTIVTRTLYKFANPSAADKDKRLAPVSVKLGVSDGFYTEVLDALADGDTIVTGVVLPGAATPAAKGPGGTPSPFSSGRSSFGGPHFGGPR